MAIAIQVRPHVLQTMEAEVAIVRKSTVSINYDRGGRLGTSILPIIVYT
jgi:hypothetical protein